MATSTLGSGTLVLAGTTSGTTTVTATAVAGTTTLTLPAATDTLVGKATTDTLTNKTLGAVTLGGTVAGGGNQINNVIIGTTSPLAGSFTTVTATGLVSATNATSSFKAIHLGAVTEFSTLNYDGISTAVVDRYDAIPAGKSYFTYVGASAITTLSSTGFAVTGTINATGGSANPLPSNFSILATSGVAKLYSYWSDNSARGSFEFHVAGGNGSLDLTAFTITDGASAKVKNVVSVGDATPSTSGAGITFPATQSASSDANTLDDYEEGTWTPTISGHVAAGAGTYTTQVATYTKVGRTVHVQASITWTAHTGTGNIRLSALPFTVMAGAGNYGGFSIGVLDNIALTANNYATAWTNINSTNVILQQTPTGGGVGGEVPMDTAGSIVYSGTYFV